MKTYSNPLLLQNEISKLKNQSKKIKIIGFIPTMGALHDGHLQLIKQCKKETDITIVSIFVNPTQFSPNEDFNKYPRPLDSDINKLKKFEVDILFTPSTDDIYPNGTKSTTRVFIPYISKLHCGQTRKNFFRGICMVVNRLFNITMPDKAYFGEKDYQQLTIIKKMVDDLYMPLEIVSCPIIRDKDGLALSSRNKYLSEEHRKQAPYIYKALCSAKNSFESGEKSSIKLIEHISQYLKKYTEIQIDYINIINPKTLRNINYINKDSHLLFAGYLGKTRLIDNISF
jgi:pantoate--beta-alanine ligase